MWIANSKAPDANRTFGLSTPELLFVGLLLGSIVTGAADIQTWADLFQPHHFFSIVLSVSGMLVAYANGRAQAPPDDSGGHS